MRRVAGEHHDVLSRPLGLAAGLTRSQWQTGASGLLTPTIGDCAVVDKTGDIRSEQLSQAALLVVNRPAARLVAGSVLRLAGVQGTHPLETPST